MVPAIHSSSIEENGAIVYLGPPTGFVVRMENGQAFYFAGDTDLFDGMRELGDRGVDVALLPVWGWGPRLGPGHMTPAQAAEAAMLVRARHAVPVHWGTLYPVGMHWVMRRRLGDPGPEVAAAVTAAATSPARHAPERSEEAIEKGIGRVLR